MLPFLAKAHAAKQQKQQQEQVARFRQEQEEHLRRQQRNSRPCRWAAPAIRQLAIAATAATRRKPVASASLFVFALWRQWLGTPSAGPAQQVQQVLQRPQAVCAVERWAQHALFDRHLLGCIDAFLLVPHECWNSVGAKDSVVTNMAFDEEAKDPTLYWSMQQFRTQRNYGYYYMYTVCAYNCRTRVLQTFDATGFTDLDCPKGFATIDGAWCVLCEDQVLKQIRCWKVDFAEKTMSSWRLVKVLQRPIATWSGYGVTKAQQCPNSRRIFVQGMSDIHVYTGQGLLEGILCFQHTQPHPFVARQETFHLKPECQTIVLSGYHGMELAYGAARPANRSGVLCVVCPVVRWWKVPYTECTWRFMNPKENLKCIISIAQDGTVETHARNMQDMSCFDTEHKPDDLANYTAVIAVKHHLLATQSRTRQQIFIQPVIL